MLILARIFDFEKNISKPRWFATTTHRVIESEGFKLDSEEHLWVKCDARGSS